VDGVGGRGAGCGGEDPVSAEEEELVGGVGEDVGRGGTVVEEDHLGQGGEGRRPWGGG